MPYILLSFSWKIESGASKIVKKFKEFTAMRMFVLMYVIVM